MATSLRTLRFLVLDDNAYMGHIVETILRGFGASHVLTARDATDAFVTLRNDVVDIVITDYAMPLLDGIEFVKLVRNSADIPAPYVPIIMLTAHSERSRIETARDAGVTEFCCKPVTPQTLFQKILSVVNHPRQIVQCVTYQGSDRRRKAEASYNGARRRASDNPA